MWLCTVHSFTMCLMTIPDGLIRPLLMALVVIFVVGVGVGGDNGGWLRTMTIFLKVVPISSVVVWLFSLQIKTSTDAHSCRRSPYGSYDGLLSTGCGSLLGSGCGSLLGSGCGSLMGYSGCGSLMGYGGCGSLMGSDCGSLMSTLSKNGCSSGGAFGTRRRKDGRGIPHSSHGSLNCLGRPQPLRRWWAA